MFDYRYTRANGSIVTVSEMPTLEIRMLLSVPDDLEYDFGITKENVMERLRIELLIRELGL